MDANEALARLKTLSDRTALEGMARYGINTKKAYGVSVSNLRELAKEIGQDHVLAQELWASGIHEARILASIVDDPRQVSDRQLERWVSALDSWDLCDQCVGNLFDKTRFAYKKAVEWSGRGDEFVKRAGFAMMARLAVHDKRADDSRFLRFLSIIEREAGDDRLLVRKAVNWALRQIGKRNPTLNRRAIKTALSIKKQDSSSARWIASDAIRELTGSGIRVRLRRTRGSPPTIRRL